MANQKGNKRSNWKRLEAYLVKMKVDAFHNDCDVTRQSRSAKPAIIMKRPMLNTAQPKVTPRITKAIFVFEISKRPEEQNQSILDTICEINRRSQQDDTTYPSREQKELTHVQNPQTIAAIYKTQESNPYNFLHDRK